MKRSPIQRRTPLKSSGSGAPLRSPKRKRSSKAIPPETRESVIRRDRSCVAWRQGFALDERCRGRDHIHHVVLRSQGGAHDESNLILLCEHHHHLAHDVRRAEAERTGVIRRATHSG